jgi:hypothetical protein
MAMTLSITAYKKWEVDTVVKFNDSPRHLALMAFAMTLSPSQRIWFAIWLAELNIKMIKRAHE